MKLLLTGNWLIPDDFYLWQAKLFCFELGSMSEIISDNRHQICTY